jgi:hypothetical protein
MVLDKNDTNQLVKKFLEFCGTWGFVLVLITTGHWICSQPDKAVHTLTPYAFKISFSVTISDMFAPHKWPSRQVFRLKYSMYIL